ncbi:MAG: hypothetical protein ACK56P_03330 [Chitinophagales bacterium]
MVRFLHEVEDYLENLIEILYQKEYFGFEESSYEYVLSVVNYTISVLVIVQCRMAHCNKQIQLRHLP